MRKSLLIIALLTVVGCFSAQAQTATVFSENFDAMTAGTADAPDSQEISADKNVDTAFTHGAQWQGRGLHQAGGALAVLHFEQKDWMGTTSVQGYVQCPYVDVRLDDGNFKVCFKAKAHGADKAIIHIEVYDPYTTNSIDAKTLELGPQWREYKIPLAHPGYGNHLAFVQMASDGNDWLLDDFAIEQDYYGLMPPITHFAKDVTYGQFTAYWNPVPLATSYLISAFTLDDAENRVYLVKDEPVDGCEHTVIGTEKGKDYYYTVRSVNDLYRSAESDPRQVHVALTALDAPQTIEATDVAADGFTARWEPVFRAMGYIVNLTREHVADAPEEFVVLHENFDKCSGYADFPDYPVPFYYNLDDYTAMPGWIAPMTPVNGEGKFGIDNHWKQYEGEGVLTSPALDLSGANGGFKVTLNVVGTAGDTVSAECSGVKKTYKLTADKERFELAFDNGTSASVLRFSFDGDATLLFDDIVISQDIKPGDTVKENLGNFNTAEDYKYPTEAAMVPEYKFSGLKTSEGDVFVYTVKVWSWSLGEDGVWGPTVYSAESEPRRVLISTGAGIEDGVSGAFSATVAGRTIYVTADKPVEAVLYDLSGRIVARRAADSGTTAIEAPASGVFILRAGAHAVKLAIR